MMIEKAIKDKVKVIVSNADLCDNSEQVCADEVYNLCEEFMIDFGRFVREKCKGNGKYSNTRDLFIQYKFHKECA